MNIACLSVKRRQLMFVRKASHCQTANDSVCKALCIRRRKFMLVMMYLRQAAKVSVCIIVFA